MKKLKCKDNATIQVADNINELTFAEVNIFQSYFLKILYDIDMQNLDDTFERYHEAHNKGNYVQALFIMENFRKSLKLQNIERNGWAICFAILIKKDKPIYLESDLYEIYIEAQEKLNHDQIKESVLNFSQAFPNLSKVYQVKAEGLTIADLMTVLL